MQCTSRVLLNERRLALRRSHKLLFEANVRVLGGRDICRSAGHTVRSVRCARPAAPCWPALAGACTAYTDPEALTSMWIAGEFGALRSAAFSVQNFYFSFLWFFPPPTTPCSLSSILISECVCYCEKEEREKKVTVCLRVMLKF